MPSPSTFALFAAAAIALLLVPGPAVIYIVTRSIHHGRRAGLVSVLGIHTGSVVHVAAAAVGVSAVLASSARAFQVVKLAGAAYLVVLGVQRLVGRHGESTGTRSREAGLGRIYRQGVFVNVLNPKTALFFLAFLPQFVDPARGPVDVQIVIFGVCFIALGLCSDSAYALAASAAGHRLRANRHFARYQERLSGVVYVGLGLTAAVAGHPARRAK